MKKLLILLALGGCTSVSYKCGEFSEGRCESVSESYKRLGSEAEEIEGVNSSKSVAHIANIKPGSAILSRPKVMRVFLTEWADTDGDLHSGGYIYVKLEDAKWQLP